MLAKPIQVNTDKKKTHTDETLHKHQTLHSNTHSHIHSTHSDYTYPSTFKFNF